MSSYNSGNDTYACSSGGCQVSCASPQFGSNVCYNMQQNFVDGTSCQGGGRCNNGQCQGASVGREITSWIDDNKPLVIGLAAGIGGLLVLIIGCCCINSCKRKRRMNKVKRNMAAAPQMSYGYANAPAASQGYWENGRWQPIQSPPPAWTPSGRYA